MSKRFWCWILICSLAFQPLVFEGYCWAAEAAAPDSGSGSDTASGQAAEMDKAQQEFDKAYKEIMATEEVKKISGFKGFVLKVVGKKDDINKKIDEANAEIKKAKEEMTKIREDVTKSTGEAKKAAVDASKAAMAKQLEAASGVKSKVAEAMKKIAGMVTKISDGLKKLGKTLAIIGAALTPIPYVGQVVGPILMKVGTVVGKIGSVMGVVAKGLTLYANKAELSAKDFAGLVNDAKTAWKNSPDYNKNPPSKDKGKTGSSGGSHASTDQPEFTTQPVEVTPETPTTGSGDGSGSTAGGEGSGVETSSPTNANQREEGGVDQVGDDSTARPSMGGLLVYPNQYSTGQRIEETKASGGGTLGIIGVGSAEFSFERSGNKTMEVSIPTKAGMITDSKVKIFVDPNSPLGRSFQYGLPSDEMFKDATVTPLPAAPQE